MTEELFTAAAAAVVQVSASDGDEGASYYHATMLPLAAHKINRLALLPA